MANKSHRRAKRISKFIAEWMNNHSEAESAWFDVDFRKHHPEYADWLLKYQIEKTRKAGRGVVVDIFLNKEDLD